MNKKETLIWSIIDNVIIACDIPRYLKFLKYNLN